MTLVGWSVLEAALLVALVMALLLLARDRRAVRRQRDSFARQGEIISQAVQRLAGVHQPDEVLRLAVALAADLISPSVAEGRRALYFVLDGDLAHVVAKSDELGGGPEPPVRVADHPALAQVVATRAPFATSLPTAAVGPSVRRSLEASGVTHGAAVPIVVNGELHGVLAVGGRGEPIKEFVRLVDLGGIVELALTNAFAAQELAEQAVTDPLTGCANRRGLELAAQALSNRHPFTVVAADLDGLKDLNDQLGHEAGDAVLQRFADVARSLVRTGDVVARVGGDEFVVLLNETDDEGASHFCTRLLHDLAATRGGPRVSLGLASVTGPQQLETAWRRADEAMYRAKAAGGMRYESASPAIPRQARPTPS